MATASKNFTSNDDVSVRMFRSDFLERFSHVHPAVPHLIYVPLVVFLLWVSKAPAGRVAAVYALGLVLWTLAEYGLHKYAFHAPDHIMEGTHDVVARLDRHEPVIPALPTWRHKLYFLAHGVHHEYPSDSSRLVMPPGASIPMAVVIYFIFRLAAGPVDTPALFAGFITGYLVYDTTHFAVHHLRMPTSWGRYLKKRHARHHYLDHDADYGVSSPLWDVVFRTFTR